MLPCCLFIAQVWGVGNGTLHAVRCCINATVIALCLAFALASSLQMMCIFYKPLTRQKHKPKLRYIGTSSFIPDFNEVRRVHKILPCPSVRPSVRLSSILYFLFSFFLIFWRFPRFLEFCARGVASTLAPLVEVSQVQAHSPLY